MLYLGFRCGGQLYALRAADISEVTPPVALRPAPGAAGGYAGMIDYRGEAVLVADLGVLLARQPSPRCWSSRIFLVVAAGRRIGLLAEGVSDTLRVREEDWVAAPEQGRGRLARVNGELRTCFVLADLLALLAGMGGEGASASAQSTAEGRRS